MLPRSLRLELSSQSVVLPQARTPLHAMITNVGYSRESSPSYDWHGLQRGHTPWALLQIGVRGRGRLEWAGREFVIEPEQAMLLEIPHDHRYHLPPGWQPWEFLYVCLNGSQVLSVVREAIQSHGPVVPVALSSELFACASSIHRRVLGAGLRSAYEASSLAYELVMKLAEHVFTLPGGPRHAQGVRRALDYCASSFQQAIDVSDLAREAGYTRHHFARSFKRSQGVSPSEYLSRLRLTEAARLLRSSELTVKQVAFACGFRDSNYFVRAFRKQWGVTPGTFRSSGQY